MLFAPALGITVALLTSLPSQTGSTGATFVEINGRTNPELVPEYRAWGAAFRFLSEGPRNTAGIALPDGLREQFSLEEKKLLFRKIDTFIKKEAECLTKGMAAREPLAKLEAAGKPMRERLSTAREVDERMWQIELECRWETLRARDELLLALSDEARFALVRFVEDKKAGLSFRVPKSGLERFRQPH